MRRTKVVDRTNQIHAMLQRQCTTCQRPATACQRGEACTERRVQPLNVCCVDHSITLRATPERLDAGRRSVDEAPLDGDDTPLRIALDDLGNADMAPGTEPGT